MNFEDGYPGKTTKTMLSISIHKIDRVCRENISDVLKKNTTRFFNKLLIREHSKWCVSVFGFEKDVLFTDLPLISGGGK